MSKDTLSAGQKIEEELTWQYPHIAKEAPEQKELAYAFAQGYKKFLDEAKIERECVCFAVAALEKAGYTVFDPKKRSIVSIEVSPLLRPLGEKRISVREFASMVPTLILRDLI